MAQRAIPAHDNAAVDGYAFAHADYDEEKGAKLKIAGKAFAGHPFDGKAPRSIAVRIFTGAIMPVGLDTVAMQENVRVEQEGEAHYAVIPPGLKRGTNRRLAGEDAKAGAVLVEPGTTLRPPEVASAAATGLERLDCFETLKVVIFSSGDEILRPGEAFSAGKVYDANAPMLQGLVQAAGAEAVDLGVLPDKADLVRAALSEASHKHHAIIVSGGASQGQEDHVAPAIDALDRHQARASDELRPDRRLRRSRSTRKSRCRFRLFSNLREAGACATRRRCLACASAVSLACCLFAEKEVGTPRILARSTD
jgi:molybdopterin molybdotransferase